MWVYCVIFFEQYSTPVQNNSFPVAFSTRRRFSYHTTRTHRVSRLEGLLLAQDDGRVEVLVLVEGRGRLTDPVDAVLNGTKISIFDSLLHP